MIRWRCRVYRVLAVDCVEGTLSRRQQERLDDHLARCPACSEELEGLRQLPTVLKTVTVPDPGEAFWQQQRQAIGRAIKHLAEPGGLPEPAGWHASLQTSVWRYPLATTAALLLAVVAYHVADRPSAVPLADDTMAAVAALDPHALAAVHESMESLVPQDDALVPAVPDDEAVLAALPAEDVIAPDFLPEVPQARDLSDKELASLGALVGGVG
ncbi:MAG: zf-HC2 domain-containing protein [Candidatus Binatia bacterium]